MARVPMVTRTIKGTKVTVMCLNIESAEPYNETLSFPEVFKNEDKMLKACKAAIDSDTVKAVAVVASEVFETLYGMRETDFLNQATILPSRGTKAAETSDAE